MRTWICVVLATSLAVPFLAYAQASGGNTGPFAATGLGQSGGTANLSLISSWKATAYERQGIRYIQVEDSYGQPRAAIAYVGSTIWNLPIGTDADRVSTSTWPISIPAGAIKRVIYTSNEIEVSVHEFDSKHYWEARKP